MAKRLYNTIFFFPQEMNRQPVKYRKVSNVYKACLFVINNIGQPTACNVYDNQTKQFITQIRSLQDCKQFIIR